MEDGKFVTLRLLTAVLVAQHNRAFGALEGPKDPADRAYRFARAEES